MKSRLLILPIVIAAITTLSLITLVPSHSSLMANEPAKEEKKPQVSASVTSVFPESRIYSRVASSAAKPAPDTKPAITSANGLLVPFSAGNVQDPEIVLKSIGGPSHMPVVQVVLTSDQVATYLRGARNFEEKLQVIKVEDNKGSFTNPSGYMLQKGDKLLIKLDAPGSIKTISEIKAMDEVKKGDRLYLIFHVPKNTTLVKLVAAHQSLDMNVTVK